jgi:hypothetical protein
MTLPSKAGGSALLHEGCPHAREIGNEHGGARLRALIWLVLLLAFVFCSWKLVPPFFANYQLQDWLRVHSTFYVVKPVPDDVIKAELEKEMQDLGIPATKENIKITANNSRAVIIQVDYTVAVDLLVYQAHLHFTPSGDGESLVQ